MQNCKKDSVRVNELDRMNKSMLNYNTTIINEPTRKNFIDAVEAGMYQSVNQGGRHINVDKESELLNGKWGNEITSDKNKVSKLLMARPFATTPNLSYGEVPDVEHNPTNRYGKITRHFKKNLDLAGITINRNTPLVPEVEQSVKYREDHINPTTWIRGGMSTRNFVRNSDYNKSCGFK